MTAVSIIIPVYNVEKYIKQALDSVVNQTLQDIEIICINDCSTDSSFDIVKEYAQRDNRFKLFEQTVNKGQGSARNLGIDNATGEYIMFLDPDDWYELNACELAYNQIKRNKNDFVVFNFYDYDELTKERVINNKFLKPYYELIENGVTIKPYEIERPFVQGCVSVMNIYNAKFINDNDIKYAEDIRLGEDVVFYFSVISKAETMSVLYNPIYTYRHNKNSISNTNVNNWQEHFIARERAYNIILKSNHNKELLKSCIRYMITSNYHWLNQWFSENTKIKKDFYKKLQDSFLFIDKHYDIESIKDYINYKDFKYICNNTFENYYRVKLADENKCSGCGACLNVCKVNAISMVEDENGFLVPLIDKEKCVNCKQCERVCPVITPLENKNSDSPKCYAAMADDNIRMNLSSSGGVFTILAEYILNNKGYVVGAAFDGIKLKHIIIDNIKDLDRLKGSKYIQSDMGSIYNDIELLLKQGKIVLFTGTPCQCSALNKYLQKDYENLFCVDLICHGVPNQKLFERYISETIKPDENFIRMNFRNKNISEWSFNHTTTLITDKSEYSQSTSEDKYMLAFSKNLSLRKSCESCKFRCIPMQGDITLGDFWGVDNYNPELNDKKGTSVVLINNEKGQILFNNIQNKLKIHTEVPLEYVIKGNPHLSEKRKIKNINKKLFFKEVRTRTVNEAVDRCLNDECDYLIHNFWWTVCNYGAILTAYSMQQLINSYGFFTKIINAKETVRKNKSKYFSEFAEKYLDLTKKYNVVDLRDVSKNVKGIILGSDQVFRLEYISRYRNLYLLNFADKNCKKIALSASFGLNQKDFLKDKYATKDSLNLMKHALSSFDYISTREISGKDICKNILGIESDFILDPVFLIDKQKYIDMMEDSYVNTKDKIVTYVLDTNNEYQTTFEKIKQNSGKEIYHLTAKKNSVEDWLKGIYDCDLFITDSFHGVCFALIFNKPFICVQNIERGIARFETLIDIFNIKNNFISDINDIRMENLTENIDYTSVNKILEKEKQRCLGIIEKVLKDSYSNNPSAAENKNTNEKYLIKRSKRISRRLKYSKTYLNYAKCRILANFVKGEKLEHYISKKKRLKREMDILYD